MSVWTHTRIPTQTRAVLSTVCVCEGSLYFYPKREMCISVNGELDSITEQWWGKKK